MNKRTVTWPELQNLVSKICRDVSASNWRPDYIVGITRGGLVPAVLISHWLDVPLETLKVSLRDEGQTESNCWMSEDAFNGKNILIVDDINDSGATINWIIEDWRSNCLPDDPIWDNVWNKNVRYAVLFDNLASDATITADYTGVEINKAENNAWIDFPFEDWWAK
jgi:xanthine phosphoribosyltransferase